MEIGQRLNPPVQCRLCGNHGDHRFEIFDSSSREISSSSLSEKILRCLDIEVISSDPTTVICAECFNKVFGYDQFREICHATNRKLKNSLFHHHSGVGNGVTFISKVKRETVAEPVNTYLISDSESNEEADETAISGNPTMKIERAEVVPEVNDSAESLADEIPVFVSTSSTIVKHEWPESATLSSKLEMIENELTMEVPMDASGSESATDAEDDREFISEDDERTIDSSLAAHRSYSEKETDTNAGEVSHDARVPRTKILRKMRSSIPTVAIKKEHEVNRKTKENASKFAIECSSAGVCRESFESREAMKLHVKFYHEKHAKRTFCCHLCKKALSKRSHLVRHMNSLHTGMVRFKCPNKDCSKMFTQKSSLNRHINAMHKNQVALECPKCSKAFLREFLLKKHLAIAHGDGIAFVCDLCDKPFARKSDLRRHIKYTHTKVTLYECPEATCTKSFKQKFNMMQHFKIVHSQQKASYKCTKCPAKFSWNHGLRAHSLRKH